MPQAVRKSEVFKKKKKEKKKVEKEGERTSIGMPPVNYSSKLAPT